MANLGLILLVFAFVFACIAAWQASQPEPIWKRMIALCFACLIAADLFGGLATLHYFGGH